MLAGNKRKMKNQGGNPGRNNQRKNFQQQQNFNAPQLNDQNPGYMDFSSNNFNEPQQPAQRQQNNMNNNKRKNPNQQQQQQNQRRPNNNQKKNFQNGGGNNKNNWNNNQPPQRRGPPPQMMNQPNQFSPPPMPMNHRMQQSPNFRNMRNGGQMPPFGPIRGPVPMMGGPMPPMPPMRGPVRRQFQKFSQQNKNNQNRKNPNLTKVDKPKNRKQNMNKRNAGNKGKKKQRDPYSLEAPFVTDEIKAEHAKKEEILESMKGKGKNDELFAKFKEQREVFVKKYDEAKAAYQAEKKVSHLKFHLIFDDDFIKNNSTFRLNARLQKSQKLKLPKRLNWNRRQLKTRKLSLPTKPHHQHQPSKPHQPKP